MDLTVFPAFVGRGPLKGNSDFPAHVAFLDMAYPNYQ